MRPLTGSELARLLPAEVGGFRGRSPTQMVSSDEYFPLPPTPAQRQVEAQVYAYAIPAAAEPPDGITLRKAVYRAVGGAHSGLRYGPIASGRVSGG